MKTFTLVWILCFLIPGSLFAQFFEIKHAEIKDNHLRLILSDTLAHRASLAPSHYELNNGMGTPTVVTLENDTTLLLSFPKAFRPGLPYRMDAKNVWNTHQQPRTFSFEVLYPEQIDVNDIILNEVLPNPLSGGAEFIEIYNRSNKTLDLSLLEVTTLRPNGEMYPRKRITDQPLSFSPGEYKVLTAHPADIKKKYPAAIENTFLPIPSFPTLNNKQGTILLVSGHLIIDQLDYDEAMHHPLVSDPKGVSLERKSIHISTNTPNNFTSAAAIVGHATPGYKNSQSETTAEKNQFSVESKTFSPDHDGFEDTLQIKYALEDGDKLVTITVHNREGKMIKELAKNLLLGTEGQIEWDGTMDNGLLTQTGIYIIHIELYDTVGYQNTYRLTCVLARKF